MSRGFEDAGFQIVAAFEFWDKAAECYALNFSHPVFTTDLSDTTTAVDEIQRFHPDIIIGGPPCQDFSHAGKRVEGSRAGLTEAYAEIIRAVRPKYFVMENVKRAHSIRLMDAGEETVLYLHHLSQCPQFQELSSSIRSQLKRAVALYGEYLRGTSYDCTEESPRCSAHPS